MTKDMYTITSFHGIPGDIVEDSIECRYITDTVDQDFEAVTRRLLRLWEMGEVVVEWMNDGNGNSGFAVPDRPFVLKGEGSELREEGFVKGRGAAGWCWSLYCHAGKILGRRRR
jgi:hypothetical protein